MNNPEIYRFKFEKSFHKGKYTNLERRLVERLIIKEYGIQLGDIFFEDQVPVSVAIILEQAPPTQTKGVDKQVLSAKKKPLINKGPEQEKIVDFVLTALEGAAYVKKDQVCYVIFSKRYADEDAIEIQIGEIKDGKR